VQNQKKEKVKGTVKNNFGDVKKPHQEKGKNPVLHEWGSGQTEQAHWGNSGGGEKKPVPFASLKKGTRQKKKPFKKGLWIEQREVQQRWETCAAVKILGAGKIFPEIEPAQEKKKGGKKKKTKQQDFRMATVTAGMKKRKKRDRLEISLRKKTGEW